MTFCCIFNHCDYYAIYTMKKDKSLVEVAENSLVYYSSRVSDYSIHFLGRVNEKAAQLHAIASIQSILGSAAAGGMAPADGVNGNNPRNTSTNLGPEVRIV